jgi:hypothetical protein
MAEVRKLLESFREGKVAIETVLEYVKKASLRKTC